MDVPTRIRELGGLNNLEALQNMVVEARTITHLIMSNLWCIRNKFIFEGTHMVTESTDALVVSQLYILQRAFGN